MKVITNRNVEFSNACGCSSLEGDYSNAKGDKRPKQQKTGAGKEKLKNIFNKVNDSGIINSVGALFGKDGGGGSPVIDANFTPPTPEPKGMTTTTKVLIGVGIVGALGLGYYLMTKKK